MSRTLIIIATVIVVVVAAITVWIAIRPSDDAGEAATPAPTSQRFDTTTAPQDQRDGQGNGGADGAADN